MIKLLIISDVRLYTECVGRVLSETNKLSVEGVACNKEDIGKLFELDHIDIILLDMRMDDSFSILRMVSSRFDKVKIIVVALPEDDDSFMKCLEFGVTGYLSKNSTAEELIDSVKIVERGGLCCPSDITQYFLKLVKIKKSNNKVSDLQLTYPKLLKVLTQRELQIIKLLAKGMSNKKISQSLFIELSTVKNHVHNILVKIGVENRSQVACFLQESNVLYQDDSSVVVPVIKS